MKHVEKDLARYSTSQMPVPNAPIGIAEFWQPRMGDYTKPEPKGKDKTPEPKKKKDKTEKKKPEQKPKEKKEESINPYYDRDHGDNYGW